jgi:hypothetical protein
MFGGKGCAVVGGPQPGEEEPQFTGERGVDGLDPRACGGVDNCVVECLVRVGDGREAASAGGVGEGGLGAVNRVGEATGAPQQRQPGRFGLERDP